MSIENRCDEIKATLQKLTDVKVSPTARLVAVLAACGISDTAEVASLVGRSVRMVQIARNELRETHCADAQPIAPDATHFAKLISQNETHCAPRVHAPAQMESPSEIDSLRRKGVSSAHEVRDIPGLGDLTGQYVDWLAGWLAGDHGFKDLEIARDILAGSVDAYGAAKVKAGMLEMKTKIAAGEKFRDLGRMFSSYIKNAKPAQAAEAPKKTLRQVLDEEKAARAAAGATA